MINTIESKDLLKELRQRHSDAEVLEFIAKEITAKCKRIKAAAPDVSDDEIRIIKFEYLNAFRGALDVRGNG